MKVAILAVLFFIVNISISQVHVSCNCLELKYDSTNNRILEKTVIKKNCILLGAYHLNEIFVDSTILDPLHGFQKDDFLWVAQDTLLKRLEFYSLNQNGVRLSTHSFEILQNENYTFPFNTFLLRCSEYDYYSGFGYKTNYTDQYLAIFNDSTGMFFKMKVSNLKNRQEFPSLLLFMKKQ